MSSSRLRQRGRPMTPRKKETAPPGRGDGAASSSGPPGRATGNQSSAPCRRTSTSSTGSTAFDFESELLANLDEAEAEVLLAVRRLGVAARAVVIDIEYGGTRFVRPARRRVLAFFARAMPPDVHYEVFPVNDDDERDGAGAA